MAVRDDGAAGRASLHRNQHASRYGRLAAGRAFRALALERERACARCSRVSCDLGQWHPLCTLSVVRRDCLGWTTKEHNMADEREDIGRTDAPDRNPDPITKAPGSHPIGT